VKCLPNAVKIIVFRALVKSLHVRAVTVEGDFGKFQGDPLDLGVLSEYMTTGTYSPDMMEFLKDWLGRFGLGTMVDVGANIGLTTVPLANADINCICFEPDINNFNALEANTASVQSTGTVQLFNVAAFDSDGTVSM
jgi:predicted RNA methylase